MSAPLLIDACCGLGGTTKGYQRAGFYVIGCDTVDQPDYCGDEFFPVDAFDFIRENHRYAQAVATSFPCQASCNATKGNRRREGWTDDHVDLNPAGRRLLDEIGLPYVMENVQGSVLRRDLTLCGLMFPETRRVFRHRYFELGGWTMVAPPHPSHAGHRVSGWRHGVRYEGDMLAIYGKGGGKANTAEAREGLGIDWSWDYDQLKEAIPPAYTEYIGRELLSHVTERAAA